MASNLSENVRSQIAILNKEVLFQCQITAGPKVSMGPEHGILNHFRDQADQK